MPMYGGITIKGELDDLSSIIQEAVNPRNRPSHEGNCLQTPSYIDVDVADDLKVIVLDNS